MKFNNSFNFNMNPYFTLTLFDSNRSNPALHKKDKPDKPDWMYSTQYNPNRLSDDQHFKNNFNYSQSWRELSPLGLIFNLLVHNFFHNLHNFHIFILRFCFLHSFSRTTLRRKISVRKEYKIHAWGRMKILGNVGLPNFITFPRFILSLTSSKWPIINLWHEYRTLAWVRATISKLIRLTIFNFSKTKIQILLFYINHLKKKIWGRKEYKNLTWVSKIFCPVYP